MVCCSLTGLLALLFCGLLMFVQFWTLVFLTVLIFVVLVCLGLLFWVLTQFLGAVCLLVGLFWGVFIFAALFCFSLCFVLCCCFCWFVVIWVACLILCFKGFVIEFLFVVCGFLFVSGCLGCCEMF